MFSLLLLLLMSLSGLLFCAFVVNSPFSFVSLLLSYTISCETTRCAAFFLLLVLMMENES